MILKGVKLNNSELVEAIFSLNISTLKADHLNALLTSLPAEEDVKSVINYPQKDKLRK